MAITLITNFTSGGFYPSANDINITVDSNNSGKCNFRYICEVFINSTKVHTSKLFPDPSTGYAFFQMSRVIDDYIADKEDLTTATQVLSSAVSTTSNIRNLHSVYFRFGEEYDNTVDCTGQVAQSLSLAQSNTFNVYQAAVDYEDFTTFSASDYIMATNSTSSTKFLTNSPREVSITYNDTWSTDFITNTNWLTTNFFVDIKTYDSSNSLLATYSYQPSSTISSKRLRVYCGPYDINKIAANTIINTLVSKYTMNLRWQNTQISEVFTFKMIKPSQFATRFNFLGLQGSSENFTFYHRRRTGYDIQKREYQKTQNSNIANNWTYRVGDRGTKTFANDAVGNGNVSSFVSKSESKWLSELWFSNNVYIYKRPELHEFKSFVDGTTQLWFYDIDWATGEQNQFEIGDNIFIFTEGATASGRYQISNVIGNKIELSTPLTTAQTFCGWIQKDASWQKLPINILDTAVEEKQKLGRPIEYQVTWRNSYSKTTLR